MGYGWCQTWKSWGPGPRKWLARQALGRDGSLCSWKPPPLSCLQCTRIVKMESADRDEGFLAVETDFWNLSDKACQTPSTGDLNWNWSLGLSSCVEDCMALPLWWPHFKPSCLCMQTCVYRCGFKMSNNEALCSYFRPNHVKPRQRSKTTSLCCFLSNSLAFLEIDS